MFCNFLSKVLIALAAVGMLSTGAMASQTIHFSQNFADNSIAPEVGDMALFAGNGFALQTQQAWRNPAASYYGPSGTVAFNPPTGYGAGGAPPAGNAGLGFGGIIGATTVNTATGLDINGGALTPVELAAGNVWIVDMSYISDMAPDDDAPGFLQGSPSFSAEVADFVTFGDDGFVARSGANSGGTTAFSSVYPNGADPNAEPSNLPVGHSAALATALNGTLRTKFAYAPALGRTGTAADATNPTGLSTRTSTQTLAGSSVLGSATHLDGSTVAGTFRSDYSAGLMVQMLNNHGTGNVTYAAGVTGLSGGSATGVNVAYNDAENAGNLELGLTNLTFKQVRNSDYNTDGVTNLAGDGAIVIANLSGTGKSFFQGDSNGDTVVNLAGDMSRVISGLGSDVVAPGTAMMKYYFNTGEVKFSSTDPGDSSGPLQLVLTVDNASLTGTNAASTGVAFKLQAGTTKDISGLPNQLAYFNGDGFTLNDVSAGLLFSPLGSDPNHSLYHFTYQNSGQDPVVGVIEFIGVPEPSSFVLAGLAGVAMMVAARRRRATV